jgi:eukaryotic-like serine/threonine-protein kinase
MAVVYRGEDARSGRPVAIKLLADNLAADAALRERFLREASIATRLDHPNVVEVLDSGETGGRPYIVMELVDGSSLAADLARRRTLEAERTVDVTLQLSAALGHAHELAIVHRDVKPANVLMTRDGRVKLADFGIARGLADGATLTTAGSVLGTVAYLSPEQARGEIIGTASDIWSLGIVIAEMSTGLRQRGRRRLPRARPRATPDGRRGGCPRAREPRADRRAHASASRRA